MVAIRCWRPAAERSLVEAAYPSIARRARMRDRLMHATESFGIRFEDYDDWQDLSLPDW
jgi:hypothetical protein